MAVAQGYGKTVTSGSVFAYDVADTRNSYIGEPTANIFPDPKIVNGTSGWGISNATGGTTTVDTGRDGGQSIKVTVASGGDQYQYRGYGYGANKGGSTFTYSAYIKTSGISGTGVGMRTYWFDINGSWIWSNNNTSTIITGTQDWTRVTATSTAPTGTYSVIAIFYPVDKNGVGTYWITDIQIEEKSHVSQFINGTRSSTQGLLDLTGNSTIDLANVSFDSNAQMTFDGTNDNVTAANNSSINLTGAEITLEAIFKPDSFGAAEAIIHKDVQYTLAFYPNGEQGTVTYSDSSLWSYSTFGFHGVFLTGEYYHVVVTKKNGVVNIYSNSEIVVSKGFGGSITSTSNPLYIGSYQTSYYSHGALPVTKIYNRALTAAEVKQNYLHYKTRFNLS